MIDQDKPSTLVPVPRLKGELLGIQYLRGLAAMMVVVYHLKPQFERMGYAGAWPSGLSSGVDIFFVISGFLMLSTTAGKPIGPLNFWWRRIVRIVPFYWLVTAFMTAVLLTAPQLLQTATYDGWHLLSSYLFIPALHPSRQSMEPLVTLGWTLNYEMFFYFIFGFCLLAPQRIRFSLTLGVIALLAGIGAALAPARETVLGFYTNTIMLEFAFGMVLAQLTLRNNLFARMPVPCGWSLLVGGLLLLVVPLIPFPSGTPRALDLGLFATAVVAGVLILEARGGVREFPILRALGDASYSIYLTQIVTTSALSQAWRRMSLHDGASGLVAFAIVDVVLCAMTGWLCYRMVERPLTRLFRPRGRSGAQFRTAPESVQ